MPFDIGVRNHGAGEHRTSIGEMYAGHACRSAALGTYIPGLIREQRGIGGNEHEAVVVMRIGRHKQLVPVLQIDDAPGIHRGGGFTVPALHNAVACA